MLLSILPVINKKALFPPLKLAKGDFFTSPLFFQKSPPPCILAFNHIVYLEIHYRLRLNYLGVYNVTCKQKKSPDLYTETKPKGCIILKLSVTLILIFSVLFLFFRLKRWITEIKRRRKKARQRKKREKEQIKKGAEGEREIRRILAPFVKKGATILSNLYIPTARGKTTEIDLLMITHGGIFVIESKNYTGLITGGDTYPKWIQHFRGGKRFYFYNPVWQNSAHVNALKHLLGTTIPLWSLIVFSEKCTLGKISCTTPRTYITKTKSLPHVIRHLIIQNTKHGHTLPSRLKKHITRLLTPCTKVSAAVKRKHINNIKKKQR